MLSEGANMSKSGIDLLDVLADELPHVGFFYLVLAVLNKSRGSQCFRVSPEKLYEKYSPRGEFTEKQIRYAIKRLTQLHIIASSTESRRYTLIEFPHRLEGTEKGTEKGTANWRKNQPVFESEGTDKGTEKGNGVDVGVGVGTPVVSSGLEEDLQTKTPAPKAARPPKPKIEGLQQLKAHIKTTWQAKTHVEFPNDRGGWVLLNKLLIRYPAENLAALWDCYLNSGDPFALKQGLKLPFFYTSVDGLALLSTTYKREGERYFEKWYGCKPFGARTDDPKKSPGLARAAPVVPSFTPEQEEEYSVESKKHFGGWKEETRRPAAV